MEGLDALTRSLGQRTPEQLAALLTRHAEPLSRRPAPTGLHALATSLWSYETLHHLVLHLDHPRLHVLATAARLSRRLAKVRTAAPAAPDAGAGYQSLMAHRLSFPDLASEPVPVEGVYAELGAEAPGPARDAAVAALEGLYEDGLAAPVPDGRVVVPPRTAQLLSGHDLGPFVPAAPGETGGSASPDSRAVDDVPAEATHPNGSRVARPDGSGPTPPDGSGATTAPAAPDRAVTPGIPTSAAFSRSPRAEAQAAAATLAAALDRLLAALAARPAALRKAGGLALRETKRLAKAAGTTEAHTRLLLDLALAAELITLTRTPEGTTALPTAAYDDWLACTPGARLVPVLTAWWDLRSIPTHTPPGETATALVRGHDRHAPALRHALLAAHPAPDRGAPSADAAASSGLTPSPSLLSTAAWHRPLAVLGQPMIEERARHTVEEAGFLALVAHGARTPLGHLLLTAPDPTTRDDALRAALDDLLPPPLRQAHFQADLTAVVPGQPGPELAGLLAACADRESEGQAVTWRFTPASVRRALDAGHDPEALLADLTGASATGALPQPLRYLVQDVARTHGRIRVVSAGCCVRSDDEALLRELVAHRGLRSLGLRLIAPTVLVSAGPPAATLEALRTAGYAPTQESETGTTVVERLAHHRSAAPAPARRPDTTLALAERLLAS
ncbi:helicase-associated domain-containing protein [Streptomyces sp. NPDC003077]|uniref:helicase-associated domain-containing protein n=1 Tax=Streptomyces sp. NPDC003077 TaxID=3154443 RepID=UPI0033A418B0